MSAFDWTKESLLVRGNGEGESYHLPGARDSTSTRCALGTSSRGLRMLTESGVFSGMFSFCRRA